MHVTWKLGSSSVVRCYMDANDNARWDLISYTPRPTGNTVFINPRALSNVLSALGRYSPGFIYTVWTRRITII